MARTITRFILCALIVVLLFGASEAAHHSCGQFFVQKNIVQRHGYYANQLVVPQQIYYQAGRDVELDAITEKILKRLELRLQAQEQHAPQRQTNTQPQAEAGGFMEQHCAKCHSGAVPKAGLVYDGRSELEAWQITAALRAMRDKTMPKDHELPASDYGPLMNELLNLEPAREE